MKFLSDVYLLNADALARELRDRTLSETRAVKHVIVGLILGGLGFDVPVGGDIKDSMGIEQVWIQIAGFLVAAVISYYGFWLLHQVNAKGDGKDFFLRFAVLTLPVGVHVALLFLIVGGALLGLTMFIASMDGEAAFVFLTISFVVASLAFAAVFFLRMRRFIAIAASAS